MTTNPEAIDRATLERALRKASAAQAQGEIARLSGEEGLAIYKAAERAAELQRTFDLQWDADMRAVQRWRAANPGNDLVLPDRGKLTEWLLERAFAQPTPAAASVSRDVDTALRSALVRSTTHVETLEVPTPAAAPDEQPAGSDSGAGEVEALPELRPNERRAFRKCTAHGQVGWYDYVPYSLSVPIAVMPCGCGRESMIDISEEEFHAVSGVPKLPECQLLDVASFNAGWDACEMLWHGRVKFPEERKAATLAARIAPPAAFDGGRHD
ncbi:MAG: hypothetical protein J7500_15545 [Sphingomonas sp.]|uniref:hypothetical protein n=1 Tax=Sphingomonas sp. TaxID=28214 RepID=UPI001B1D763B|nr:hypothetical protein [Sphingomonas sp.]MBO9624121.1 hypothetical protein [Sphingomonas sp.]